METNQSNVANIKNLPLHSSNDYSTRSRGRGESYFDILRRGTIMINWLLLSIVIFTGVNFFLLYRWHMGNLKYAIYREASNINSQNFDSFYQKVNSTNFFRNSVDLKIPDSIKDNANKKHMWKRAILSDIVKKRINKLEELKQEGSYSILPFIGVPFFITDYVLMLLIIGLILFFWLLRSFKQCRDVFKEYFNSPYKLNQTDAELISSLFYYIFPSSERYKLYKHIELSLYFYVISIVFILLSNIYELFFTHSYGMSLIMQPGFKAFIPHIISTNMIILCSIALAFIILIKSKRYLLDLRNLILLTNWEHRAIYPALSESLTILQKGAPDITFIKDKSYLEYRRINDTFDLFFVINAVFKKGAFEIPTCSKAKINLPKSLKSFYKSNQSHDEKTLENRSEDKILGRYPTEEEMQMKAFFIKLISSNETYEANLCQEWKRDVDKLTVRFSTNKDENTGKP
ncbi:MAG: hypothetical protein V1775_03520 [Bacteroidota bacterium]